MQKADEASFYHKHSLTSIFGVARCGGVRLGGGSRCVCGWASMEDPGVEGEARWGRDSSVWEQLDREVQAWGAQWRKFWVCVHGGV